MRLLDRYLFRELFAPLVYCLIGIQSVIIFVTVFSDAGKIEDARLHFGETIEYAAAASMDIVPIVLPVSLLLALLMALTQHARHNEITAMRAAGIGLWRICAPYFVVGLIASAALFALNESVVPRAADWSKRLLQRHSQTENKNHVLNLGFTNEREHRLWRIADYSVDTGRMVKPQVEWTLTDGSSRFLQADAAVDTNGVWTFFNAHELVISNGETHWSPYLDTNVLAMPEFEETPAQIRNEIKIGSYLNFNPDIPLKDVLTYLRWHPNLSRTTRARLLTELQDHLATPLTCLVVSVIAIPFGAAPGRRNLFFGVAGSIFICFTYFVLQRLSLAFGSSGAWPPWLAAWLPNLAFGVLGVVLTARIR